MEITQLKALINKETQIPCELLTGEDAATILTQARELLTWNPEKLSTRDQFARYMAESLGYNTTSSALAALDAISEAYEAESRLYPSTRDTGEIELPDPRTPQEKLRDKLWHDLSFNPRKDGGTW